MFLTDIELTATTYSANVDGKRYTAQLTGTVAEAIEDIRAQVSGAAAKPKKEKKPPLPKAKVIDTEPKADE